METILRQAIEALRIDVPVMAWEIDGKLLRLFLYGGAIIEWQIPADGRKMKARLRSR